ncbi:NDP-hexose 2,3-dehydratase family protein [Aeromicrobium sp. CF3.5]|uniref:NDP-hexose 2,3-dehydratase family protein n=1 Tax=Aeromicrobium sp. CF3.5 TaxID=3373078 RepID=UPI003EE4439E
MTSLAEYLEHTRLEQVAMFTEATVVPLEELKQWHAGPGEPAISHRSGGFFTIEGIDVTRSGGATPHWWQQPAIVQREVGMLGLLIREIGGVLHCLMQNKAEPGNINGIQLSPTVQATRSNFTRRHGGASTPYLEHFFGGAEAQPRRRILADVRQSEHGSCFQRKRNRNMVVEVTGDVPVLPNFHWLTLGQIATLMRMDNVVNMEARSVLSCLPFHFRGRHDDLPGTTFREALGRSFCSTDGGVTSRAELGQWITGTRTVQQLVVRRIPLQNVAHWRFTGERISHADDRFFRVLGVQVRANGREVTSWDQPILAPASGPGVVAFVVRRIDGVVHLLARLRSEGGNLDGPEVGPTVQCTPAHNRQGGSPMPPLLDRVLAARPDQVHFDQMLSDEGGRFFRMSNRHLIVELDDVETPPEFAWLTVGQLSELLEHENYVNIQARSLLTCLQSVLAEHEE